MCNNTLILVHNCAASFSNYTGSVVDRQHKYSGLKLRRGTEVFCKNLVPGPLHPTQIPRGIPGIGSGRSGHVETQKGDVLKVTTVSKVVWLCFIYLNLFQYLVATIRTGHADRCACTPLFLCGGRSVFWFVKGGRYYLTLSETKSASHYKRGDQM
jgi:hypothetical protein